jgi:hypothetical protein
MSGKGRSSCADEYWFEEKSEKVRRKAIRAHFKIMALAQDLVSLCPSLVLSLTLSSTA